MDSGKAAEFRPGDRVRFIFTENKLKTVEQGKENIRFRVVKLYKHYVLCKSEAGYNECFSREEIRRV